MDDPKVQVNFKIDKRRKRLAQALVPLLEKANLTEIMEAALDEYICQHMTPEMQEAILRGTNSRRQREEDDQSPGQPDTQRPRRKAKAA